MRWFDEWQRVWFWWRRLLFTLHQVKSSAILKYFWYTLGRSVNTGSTRGGILCPLPSPQIPIHPKAPKVYSKWFLGSKVLVWMIFVFSRISWLKKVWYWNCKWLGLLNSVFLCTKCVCKNHSDDENVTYPVITTSQIICPVPHLIGNAVCDKEAYNDNCEWDRKDCGNY